MDLFEYPIEVACMVQKHFPLPKIENSDISAYTSKDSLRPYWISPVEHRPEFWRLMLRIFLAENQGTKVAFEIIEAFGQIGIRFCKYDAHHEILVAGDYVIFTPAELCEILDRTQNFSSINEFEIEKEGKNAKYGIKSFGESIGLFQPVNNETRIFFLTSEMCEVLQMPKIARFLKNLRHVLVNLAHKDETVASLWSWVHVFHIARQLAEKTGVWLPSESGSVNPSYMPDIFKKIAGRQNPANADFLYLKALVPVSDDIKLDFSCIHTCIKNLLESKLSDSSLGQLVNTLLSFKYTFGNPNLCSFVGYSRKDGLGL